ncbi:MAG: hypothetical protein WBB28_01205 [Crinalium sp.]
METQVNCIIVQLQIQAILLTLSAIKNAKFEKQVKRDVLGRFAEKVANSPDGKEQVKALVNQGLIRDPELASTLIFLVNQFDLPVLSEGLKLGAGASPEIQDKTIRDSARAAKGIKNTLKTINTTEPLIEKGREAEKRYKHELEKMKALEGETEPIQQIARITAIAAEVGSSIAVMSALNYSVAAFFGEATLTSLMTSLNKTLAQKAAISTTKNILEMSSLDEDFYNFLGFSVGVAIGKAYRECVDVAPEKLSPEMRTNMEFLAKEMDRVVSEAGEDFSATDPGTESQFSESSKKTIKGLSKAVKG